MVQSKVVIIFVGISILIVIASFFISVLSLKNSHEEQPSIGIYWTSSDYWTNDEHFIRAMKNIGKIVPWDEKLAISIPLGPQISYFTQHETVFTKDERYVSSERSVLEFMIQEELNYLLVFEKDFKLNEGYNNWLSNATEIYKLNSYFQPVAEYSTDNFKIHLYNRR